MKTEKAQSAMEYLMTYGWAILIIAVVLGALFSLGVFSGSSLLGTSCVASPGYYCSSPILNPSGLLSLTFGQNIGSPIYNLEIACTGEVNTIGMPYNGASWTVVYSNGITNTYNTNANIIASAFTFSSGQTLTINGLQCYLPSGLPLGFPTPAAIGTTYSGYLMINFTTSPGCTPPMTISPCTWSTTKVATLTLKVV